MTMPLWAVISIIVLVLAIIFSNVMLVKKTAHMKMPNLLRKHKDGSKAADDWEKDEWDKNDWKKDDWGDEDWQKDNNTEEQNKK